MFVMELHGKTPKIRKQRPSPKFVIPDGLIGLEYEWESCEHFDWGTEWGQRLQPFFSSHNDGSLRNGGIEFVLREPLFGENLLAAITTMDEAARAFRFKSSYRTSMHVHLDMERATYPDQVLSTALLYALAEPFLYKFVGQARDMCNYCLPWYRHDQHFNVFLRGIHEYKAHSAAHLVGKLKQLKEYKYSGLNFFSLGDFGTLEFRQCPVGLDATRVVDWVNMIQSLKAYALNGGSYNELLDKAYIKGLPMIMEIFGERSKPLLRFSTRADELFQIGLKTASSFAVAANTLGYK